MPRPALLPPPPEPAVRLDPLPDMVGYALRRAQVAVFRTFSKAFAEFDVRPAQLGVLTVVGNNPGLKQSEVAEALGIQRANIVPLIDGLAARGLVERAKAAVDRRSHALRLTDAGRELLGRLQRREAEYESQLTAAIGETGRRRLLELLAAITAACDEPSEPA